MHPVIEEFLRKRISHDWSGSTPFRHNSAPRRVYLEISGHSAIVSSLRMAMNAL
jgi:hypothetical protein